MKKPDTVFQIENDITLEQFAVLCILLGMCEAEPGSPATTLKYLAATYYVDTRTWDRDDLISIVISDDLISIVINGFEGIDKDEIDCNLPLHLAEEFRRWGWEHQFQPLVQSVNEFIKWAWNNFIVWEI